jgi:predicted dehydrogenase
MDQFLELLTRSNSGGAFVALMAGMQSTKLQSSIALPVQVAIVGCGAVAQRLYRGPLRQLEKLNIVRVASLVDPVPLHADSLGTSFPLAKKYRDLDDALARSAPDLALILSPAHLHRTHVVQALRHHAHVLCEKPMASSVDACAAMQAAAVDANRLLAIGMIRRYYPAFSQLKEVIDTGRIGDLVSFEYREGHKFEWDVTTPAAFRPRPEGGTGVLFDIGPHVIDHLNWTFGPLAINAYFDDAWAGVESNARIDVITPSCPGTIHLSWDHPQSNELRVRGTRGDAVLRLNRFDQLAIGTSGRYESQRISAAYPADLQPQGRTLSPVSYPQAIYCQLIQTLRAIALGEPVAVDAESGQQTVALLESALDVAQPLATPWLEEWEQAAAAERHWTVSR